MSGGEYEPKDSRHVTLRNNAPGKRADWRETEVAEGGELEPKDSRNVTLQQNTPGKTADWREDEQPGGKGATARTNAQKASRRPGDTPPGVPQERPFTAKEAAEDSPNRRD